MMKTYGYASCWSMPIMSGSGEASGIIAIYRREPVNPTTQQQDLIDRFAKIAGIAIDRAGGPTKRSIRPGLELTHVARIATLSAMTASITHEVSQPISGILTNANTGARMLAADPPNVVGAAETVRRTIRDANRASEVIKRLRAMFAKKAPTMERVDLNEAAREVIAMSAAELRRSRAVLQTDFAELLPAISGDRVQLQQVILNLLLNAADAMAGIEDRPRTLRVQTQIHGSDSIQLLVRDSGVGLDPRGIEKLFEAFHTTKAHGLGIGLAISRSIIESHKGQLWATAQRWTGRDIRFLHPLRACADHTAIRVEPSLESCLLGFSGGANSKPSRHIHQVDEGRGVHLFHDPTSMCLDSDLTDIQLEADLLVHQSLHDEIHDLALALGQRGEPLLQLTLSSFSLQIGLAAKHRVTNRLDHYLVIERLGQKFSRTCFHCSDRRRNIAIARYEYDRCRGLLITYALLDIETAEIRKIDVQDQAARDYGRQSRQKLLCRFEQRRLPPLVLNQELQGFANRDIIVNNDDCRCSRRHCKQPRQAIGCHLLNA